MNKNKQKKIVVNKIPFAIKQIHGTAADKRKNGYALLLVLLLVSSAMAISLVSATLIQSEIKNIRETSFSTSAIYAADSGIERALYALYKENNINFKESNVLSSENNARYEVNIIQNSSNLTIHSEGKFQNTLREMETIIPTAP